MNQKSYKKNLLALIEKKRGQLNNAYLNKNDNTEYYRISLEMDDLIEQYIDLYHPHTVMDT